MHVDRSIGIAADIDEDRSDMRLYFRTLFDLKESRAGSGISVTVKLCLHVAGWMFFR